MNLEIPYKEIQNIQTKTEEVLSFLGYDIEILWGFNDRLYATIADAEITEDNEFVIRYSSRYWKILTAKEKTEIVTHEVCHITAGIESGGKTSHNKTWKNHMIRCGYEPRLSLDISLPYYLRPFRTVAVGFCPCKGHPLTKRKLALALKKGLKCESCKERIKIWS